MLKKILTGFAAAAVMASGVVASAPAASADTAGCVSKTEYKKVSKGTNMQRVHRIFDTAGRQSYVGYGSQLREYKPCGSRYGFVHITYDKRNGAWYLDSKSAYWG
jgi:CRISPR/Cas system CMR-associated protein Cmr3 (group 5 of RAMP superfamily)